MPIIAPAVVVNNRKLEVPLPNNQRLLSYSGEVQYTHHSTVNTAPDDQTLSFVIDPLLPLTATIIEQTLHVTLADVYNNSTAINARWGVFDVSGTVAGGRYTVTCKSRVQDADGYIYRVSYFVTARLSSTGWTALRDEELKEPVKG